MRNTVSLVARADHAGITAAAASLVQLLDRPARPHARPRSSGHSLGTPLRGHTLSTRL